MHPFLSMTGAVAAGCALSICGAAAQSSDDGALTVADPLTLGEIVVTATRREQPISDVQASVEVITRDELDRTSGSTVIEALRYATGLDARSSGANSTVTIRGQIPNAGTSVLILVDGLPRPAKFGIDNLNLIGIDSVERIEIIRGPMSALYGADAAGGVVNIITKAPDGIGGSLRSTLGMAASADGDGRQTLNLGGTAFYNTETTAHRISADARFAKPFAFDGETVDDLPGISHLGLAYSGRLSFGADHEMSLTLEAFRQRDHSTQSTRSGATFTQVEKETRLFGALGYVGQIGPGELTLEASHGYTDGSANRSAVVESTEFSQTVLQGRYFLPIEDTAIGDHALLFGTGFRRDDIEVDIFPSSDARNNWHLLVQNEWVPTDWLSVVAGVRVDHFSDFGTHVVPRVTAGSRGDGFTWRLGFGEAFRAPSLIEQNSRFVRGRFLILGDPDIEAEETLSYEAAIGWRGERGRIEAIYHRSDITNLIDTVTRPGADPDTGLIVVQYDNVDEALIQGVELVGEIEPLDGLTFGGSYEYLDAKDGLTDQRLQDRARHTVKLSATYQDGPFAATVRGRGFFDYFAIDAGAPRGTAPESSNFGTMDVNLRYDINDVVSLSLGVDNIFDRQVPDNYNSNGAIEDPAGRFVYLTTEVSF